MKGSWAPMPNESVYRQILHNLPAATVAVDREGRVIFWNAAMEELTGVSAENVLGKTNYEYALPLYGRRRPLLLDYVREGVGPSREDYADWRWDGENLIATADFSQPTGDSKHLCVVARPLKGHNNACLGAVETLYDITAQQEAKRSLAASEREKNIILENLAELVSYQDRELRLIWLNNASAKAAGLTREEMLGRRCHEIWAQRTEPCHGCPVILAIKTGKTHSRRMTTPDGRTWWVTGSPVRDGDGAITGAVETTLDLTAFEKRAATPAPQ